MAHASVLGSRRRRADDLHETRLDPSGAQRTKGPPASAPGCSMETRHLTDDTGAERATLGHAARGATPLRLNRASSSGGRFQSGQMGQTVNLVVTPSAVRIRLSPPASQASLPMARLPWLTSRPVPAARVHLRGEHAARIALSVSRSGAARGGRSSMVELQPSKLIAWVRFPSPAPAPQRVQTCMRFDTLAASMSQRPSCSSSRQRSGRRSESALRRLRSRIAVRASCRRASTRRAPCCCSSVVEHFLGKEEVLGSSPSSSSSLQRDARDFRARARSPQITTSLQQLTPH